MGIKSDFYWHIYHVKKNILELDSNFHFSPIVVAKKIVLFLSFRGCEKSLEKKYLFERIEIFIGKVTEYLKTQKKFLEEEILINCARGERIQEDEKKSLTSKVNKQNKLFLATINDLVRSFANNRKLE